MQVRVKLFATLTVFAPVVGLSGTPFDLDVADDCTLGGVVERLKLPSDQVKITFVNGIVQPLEWKLKAGDDIGIFPPVGGGAK